KSVSTIQNNGRALLTSIQKENNGSIDWFLSTNGGNTWNPINLGEEFSLKATDLSDVRLKAILTNPFEGNDSTPIIESFKLKTHSMVLQSQLEVIEINLMKTNFKIDSHTNATK